MFERFTDRARRVLILAQQEGRLLRHDCIAPEHLLLGLLAEGESVAAKALQSLEISGARAREVVTTIVGRGESEYVDSPPFTAGARRSLVGGGAATPELASAVARRVVARLDA